MDKNGHQAKGYRLCKIVTLGQKLKMHKNMFKTFLQHIAVVLCKKTAPKTTNIRKNKSILKMAKNGHQAKAIDFAKSSHWVKN